MNNINLKTAAITMMVGIAHVICGIAAIYVPGVLNVAPMAGVFDLIHWLGLSNEFGGYILLVVGSLAIYGSSKGDKNFLVSVLLLMPQQALLFLQIWSISVALVVGMYPDGYVPVGGPWFILTDQIWAWMLTVTHSVWLTAYIYQGLRYGSDTKGVAV